MGFCGFVLVFAAFVGLLCGWVWVWWVFSMFGCYSCFGVWYIGCLGVHLGLLVIVLCWYV